MQRKNYAVLVDAGRMFAALSALARIGIESE